MIEGGYNVLVGSDVKKINEGFEIMSKCAFSFSVDIYGKGQASRAIVSQLIAHKKVND